MAFFYCKVCGHIMKPDEACPRCGSNDRDIFAKEVGFGAEKSKVFVAEFDTKVGIEPKVDAAVNEALSVEEKPLWKRVISCITGNIEIDGFSVGFPAGVMVYFKFKKPKQ